MRPDESADAAFQITDLGRPKKIFFHSRMPLILFFRSFLDVVVCDTEETNARHMDNFCCKSTVVHGKVKRLRLGSWFMENYGCQKRPKKEDKRHSWLNVQDSFFQTTLRRHHSRKLHHDDCDKTLWLVCTASHTIEGTTTYIFHRNMAVGS